MPYLDYADTTLIKSSSIGALSLGGCGHDLMEHDDGTNYKVLATKLLEAAGQILKSSPILKLGVMR